MLGHLGVNVPDLSAAKRYYDQLMPLVGFEPFLTAEDKFAFRPIRGQTRDVYLLLPRDRGQFLFAASRRTATSRLHGEDSVSRA